MSDTPRSSTSRLWGVGLFGLGFWWSYLVSTVVSVPVLWYLPLERSFVWSTRPAGLAADFYGRVLLCTALGVGAAGLGALVPARVRTAVWRDRVLVWGLSALVFTSGLYIYLLVGRSVTPVPLPTDYVPR